MTKLHTQTKFEMLRGAERAKASAHEALRDAERALRAAQAAYNEADQMLALVRDVIADAEG